MDFLGKCFPYAGEAFEYVESCAGEVDIPFEIDPDEREPAAGTGADCRDAGNAVHHGFDGNRNSLFDFFRSQATSFCLYGDARDGNVGKYVDG